MSARTLLVDAQLLVLFVVGRVRPDLVGTHKRLKAYMLEDYDLLVDILGRHTRILFTQSVLAETSNLVANVAEPAREAVLRSLRDVVGSTAFEERYPPSTAAGCRFEFLRLGLTDAALLDEVQNGSATLLTADHALYEAALRAGCMSRNFTHLRAGQLWADDTAH